MLFIKYIISGSLSLKSENAKIWLPIRNNSVSENKNVVFSITIFLEIIKNDFVKTSLKVFKNIIGLSQSYMLVIEEK